MKNVSIKKVLIVSIVLTAFAFSAFSNYYENGNDAQDTTEISYNDMNKEDRMKMLSDLKEQYLKDGNTKAAEYIQGRMEYVEKTK